MRSPFSSFAPTILYWAGVALGVIGLFGYQLMGLPSRLIASTTLGTKLFVLGCRTRVNPMLAAISVTPALLAYAWFTQSQPYALAFASAAVMFLGMMVNIRMLRVLSVSNQGRGRWELHLNIVKAKITEEGPMAEQWRGANAELTEIAALAAASKVRKLELDSPLLVSDDTVKLLVGKLEKLLIKQGLTPEVEVKASKPMGAFKAGVFSLMRRYQSGLKSHRLVAASDRVLMTRGVVIRLA